MTQKPISPADGPAVTAADAPRVRVVFVTLDNHLSEAIRRAERVLQRDAPGLSLSVHAAADWAEDAAALARCHADIAQGDIIIATMLFMEDHIRAVAPALAARREHCDALVCAMSAAEVVRLTKMGPFRMDGGDKGPLALLKKLRGKSPPGGAGAGQMAMLRRLPQILRYVPGKAQDLRAYFLTLQYWLAGSEDNVVHMVRALVDRYADGPRRALRGALKAAAPIAYPETGLYHPRAVGRIVERIADVPAPANPRGTVGLLLLRSYVLAGDTAHYDGVIAALEAKGLRVLPAFASGLDARPAIDAFFRTPAGASIDAMVSLSGFSLVGGPAYNDSEAAAAALGALDVPYLAAHPLEFQTLQRWARGEQGLTPLEATMMVALPELDGATGPIPFGGRAEPGVTCTGCDRACTFDDDAGARAMRSCSERAEMLAARVAKLVELRATPAPERRLAIVLFNFPPNSGAVGSAAFLSVFESLHATLVALGRAGYDVDAPASVDALRARLLEGNASRYGADANVHTRIAVDDHVRREPRLADIETQWGPAPGRSLADSAGINILGAQFGSVFVGVQPPFGVEGDPMRLLFSGGYAPTHAFSAFYRFIREDFGAHAILHFGTHGALEFMPGKQAGLSARCWPDVLIGATPNVYLYAANNPSEGALAKRRSAATLVSYMTPPIAQAGLSRDLADLKDGVSRWRAAGTGADRSSIAEFVAETAAKLDLVFDAEGEDAAIEALAKRLSEIETTLIPEGLHVVGQPLGEAQRIEFLAAIAEGMGAAPAPEALERLARGADARTAAKASRLPPGESTDALFSTLAAAAANLADNREMEGLLAALDGRFIAPAPGGDVLRTPGVMPTGRNLHGFDPFRIPSAFATHDGARQAERLLARHQKDGKPLPETVAMVLWGTDNLKSEGGPIAQTLALLGARPKRDSYGRLCGAELIPLADLGRPRIDVVATLSGVFRDLLPLQIRMLAEAAWLAATADEPPEQNFVRKHTLAHQARLGCDLDTAALRVFSNAEGAYGANVNQLIDAGAWTEEDELADAFESRKGFAYGRAGRPIPAAAMLGAALATVDLAYQNLDSVELGVTSLDQYVDTLGGVSRAVRRARGEDAAVYIGDQTSGAGVIRTLAEQVTLETRTRMLNPRWYEGMLAHGFEGVRQIEAHVTTTMGWSATTGQVEPWIYQRITETYVLDPEMRQRLAELNPKASARVANRLLEASERRYWAPDPETLKTLQDAADDLEDRLEGVAPAAA
ncbi:MAG: magnesium chelatase subunit H [Alphaproteobacteria bacterium]|nr:magnesium chelatase subunit H [Alphaproteobacteria bacterium]